jgi:hypothetical protein
MATMTTATILLLVFSDIYRNPLRGNAALRMPGGERPESAPGREEAAEPDEPHHR